MKLLVGVLFLCIACQRPAAAETVCGSLKESALKACLRSSSVGRHVLRYDEARRKMFCEVDNVDGKVHLAYSGAWFDVPASCIPDSNIVNTEHTWPQSKFKDGKVKSDLHHLYPVYAKINSFRGNNPFLDISDGITTRWLIHNDEGELQPPPESSRDNYSEYVHDYFEPREAHKGTAARALLYVYGTYDSNSLDMDWFAPQIDTLLKWHLQHPATETEIARTKAIARIQGNVNPFVVDATLACRMFASKEACRQHDASSVAVEAAADAPVPPSLPNEGETLKIATWNIEHLTLDGPLKRTQNDYDALAKHAQKLDAHVVALQEVDGVEAASKVFPSSMYNFHFSRSSDKQNVGFAIKKGVKWKAQPDLDQLNVGSVRKGVRITLNPDADPIEVLGVHLKSFCFDQPRNDQSIPCEKLWHQVDEIEKWMDDLAEQGKRFIVLGDFNRRLNSEDEAWAEWNDGQPDGLSLKLSTKDRESKCWGGKYSQFIDHIILNDVAIESGSFDQLVFDLEEKSVLSDYCPISIRIAN